MKAFLPALALVLSASSVLAQGRPRLQPEQRIRLTMLSAEMVSSTRAATVLEDEGDSLFVQISGVQRQVPIASVTRLEVSAGQGSRGRWLVNGAGIGTAAGLGGAFYRHRTEKRSTVIRYTACPGDTRSDGCPVFEDVLWPLSHVAPTVVVGTVLGAAIGALFPGDRWQSVPVRASAALLHGTPALTVSLRR